MTRIAIIGNAGGGKSTLARELHALLGLPLHAIDQLQWRPGWQPTPPVGFFAAHTALLTESHWIIDGWGDFAAIEARFDRADTLVLVDYPLWRHYAWALKRQFLCLFRARPDGPPGCPMLPMTWPLLKMIWSVDRLALPRLRALVDAHRDQKKVFHVRTLPDLRALLQEATKQRERSHSLLPPG